jgi:hypothetical protein
MAYTAKLSKYVTLSSLIICYAYKFEQRRLKNE